MENKAKKFTFELENNEELKISSEKIGVLKFHGVTPVENEIPHVIKEQLDEDVQEVVASPKVEEKLVALKVVPPIEEVVPPIEEVAHTKLVLNPVDETKKARKKKFKNNNYFGVKNHLDLFEVGKHYTNSFQNGVKSLAFHGDQKKSVHHTILGIASFFNYHNGMKATVFVDKFEGSELSKFLKPTHIEMELLGDENEDDTYEVHSCDGVDVVELNQLKHIAFKMGMDNFNEFLSSIVEKSEIIFWDLPGAASINKEREFYLPILNVINSLSLVVDAGTSKLKRVKEMNVFAAKYQISVEGVLMYKNLKRS